MKTQNCELMLAWRRIWSIKVGVRVYWL